MALICIVPQLGKTDPLGALFLGTFGVGDFLSMVFFLAVFFYTVV
jgi:hypothetical protein